LFWRCLQFFPETN